MTQYLLQGARFVRQELGHRSQQRWVRGLSPGLLTEGAE